MYGMMNGMMNGMLNAMMNGMNEWGDECVSDDWGYICLMSAES
jgi:hypothetical protein